MRFSNAKVFYAVHVKIRNPAKGRSVQPAFVPKNNQEIPENDLLHLEVSKASCPWPQATPR